MPAERRARERDGLVLTASSGDPTRNVLALVEAANRRQDDLRGTEARHIEFVANLRAEHTKEMREAESSRVNAVRQIDTLAVSTAAHESHMAIEALERTAAANAENLRNALTTTAATIASQTAANLARIDARIAGLEKAASEAIGKQQVADPMLAELVSEMRSLTQSRASGEGKSEGIHATWGVLLAVLAAVGTMMAIATGIITLVIFLNRQPPAAVYTPAPFGTQLPSNPPTTAPR